jgi:epoxyqueuosine reductase
MKLCHFFVRHLKNSSRFAIDTLAMASSSDIQILTRKIREEALRLGFLRIGFARAGRPPYEEQFKSWLENRFHGGMHYLKRQASRRMNPGLVLAGVRSVIVLALNYSFDCAVVESPLNGRISRYAWGSDYHPVIKNRLDRLLAFIRCQVPDVHGLSSVDSGPVMEKAWGSQTSIGWMGKNTILITRDHGSRFFIGVILLDIELEYDPKAKDFCGTCNRCIRACPSRALSAPYVLDARRCISYLTVEFRGVIPREIRPFIGSRIYGCDDCQDACPWNRKPLPANAIELMPQAGNYAPQLLSLAAISREEFDRRFVDSPIRRITRDVFIRNIMIALGNSSQIESVPVLEKALRDFSPLVRAHAVWALGQMPGSETSSALESARKRESDASVLEEMDAVLGRR